jgi:hypothetical protein
LDKALSQEAKDEIIIQSIEKLLEKDSPQLETMKMQVPWTPSSHASPHCSLRQVDFDCSFLEDDNNFHKTIRLHKKLIATSRQHIAELVMHDANDFEALTTLYRKIFRFLLDFVPSSESKQQSQQQPQSTASSDRVIEREVAAALESVFPRIGLKAFVQLSYDEKTAQLMELGRIVFGIRLFNRHQGRGGAGIDSIEETSSQLGDDVSKEITREIDLLNHLCNKYQEVIVKAHLQKRRNQIRRRAYAERKMEDYKDGGVDGAGADEGDAWNGEEGDEENGGGGGQDKKGYPRGASNASLQYTMNDEDEDEEVGDWLVTRWANELSNRRQYLAFLRSLSEEVTISHKKITELIESMSSEQAALSELVGTKASVSKEQVYPKFDNLASIWLTLWEESKLLSARHHTYLSLKKFKSSYVTALTERMYSTLGRIIELKGDELSLAATHHGEYDHSNGQRNKFYEADSKGDGSRSSAKGTKKGSSEEEDDDEDDEGDGGRQDGKSSSRTPPRDDSKTLEKASSIELLHKPFKKKSPYATIQKDIILETVSSKGATLLSVHDTPDFMQLPLELQGFCPWTIVQANGLLVPGKPALGVIRYENLFYVCEHKIAIKAFMTDPDEYLKKILFITQKCPEYIHLLRLQNYFPSASIARLIDHPEFDKQSGGVGGTSSGSTIKPLTKDASTGTPTHFQESNINPNYHWNEWELRRRVLKVANLKNCKTTSQQTDLSHFKRESETQIYLPKQKETQTRKDHGTNPPIKVTYIAGLRGKLPNDDRAISKFVPSEGMGKNKARVVTLTLDP